MNHPFLRRLALDPVLCDGAMGTILLARGAPSTRAFDELNLTDPRLVGGIHREYIAAGAEVIETNTFGANRVRLTPHGLAARVREINLHGVKIARDAREVAGENVFVAGAMGPLGRPLAEVREMDPQVVCNIFREQAEGLLEGGADLLIVETFGDVEELALAVEAIRAACDLPVVAQLTFDEDGLTLAGQTAAATGVEEPQPTRLAQLLAQGRWVVSVEIDPPRGLNPAKALRGAAMLREETNVDLVNIPDNPMARVRMAALALA